MNFTANTEQELLDHFYHYKAMYEYLREVGEDANEAELLLRQILLEMQRRNIQFP